MVTREARGGHMYIALHDGLGCRPHYHEDLEMVLMLKGNVDAYAESRRYELQAGDLFLTFPHQVHSYDRDSESEQSWLIIVPVSMCSDFKSLLYNRHPMSNRLPAERVAPEIPALLEKMHTASGPLIDSIRKALWLAVLGMVLQELPLEQETSGQRDLLRHVLDYCIENLDGDLQLDQVAKNTGVGKYHISHLFQKSLGMGFHEYINTLRVNESARLLRETDVTITEVAYQVGFSCSRTFNRAFQKQMGCSPRDYKKTQLAK